MMMKIIIYQKTFVQIGQANGRFGFALPQSRDKAIDKASSSSKKKRSTAWWAPAELLGRDSASRERERERCGQKSEYEGVREGRSEFAFFSQFLRALSNRAGAAQTDARLAISYWPAQTNAEEMEREGEQVVIVLIFFGKAEILLFKQNIT